MQHECKVRFALIREYFRKGAEICILGDFASGRVWFRFVSPFVQLLALRVVCFFLPKHDQDPTSVRYNNKARPDEVHNPHMSGLTIKPYHKGK